MTDLPPRLAILDGAFGSAMLIVSNSGCHRSPFSPEAVVTALASERCRGSNGARNVSRMGSIAIRDKVSNTPCKENAHLAFQNGGTRPQVDLAIWIVPASSDECRGNFQVVGGNI